MKIKEWCKKNILYIIIWALCTLVLGVLIFPVFSSDYINYDSAYQYGLTQHSFSEIWELIPKDYSPPLYSIILKLYTMLFGSSLYTMRTMNIIIISAILLITLFPFRTAFGARASITYTLAVFFSATTLNQVHEIRPTIPAFFFITAIAVYAYLTYFQEKRSYYICFTVFVILGMYTHNIVMLGALGIYVLMLLFSLVEKEYGKFKKILASGIAASVIYIPWLIVVFSQFKNATSSFAANELSFELLNVWLLTDIMLLLNNSIVGRLLVIVFPLILCFSILKLIDFKKIKGAEKINEIIRTDSQTNKRLIFIAGTLLFPLIVIFVFHFAAYPLICDRYLHIIGMIVIMIMSILASNMCPKICAIIFSLLFVINGTMSVLTVKENVETANLDIMVENIKEENPDGRIVFLHTHEWTIGTMYYYFPDAEHYIYDKTFTVLNDMNVFGDNIIDVGSIENIWNYTDKVYVFNPEKTWDDTYSYDEIIEILMPDTVNTHTKYINMYSYMQTCTPVLLEKSSEDIELTHQISDLAE